ncbi:gliding motility-associated C-terminal domain-containing protein, partial [Flavobacteriales bacterium]|nr:gliding motility-associated C-terminal domain-containing protein [Flavobacteriales bacterium]
IAPICVGDPLTLPTTSIEGFTGTWSPAINNMATTTYTFTPSTGLCATNATLSISITLKITPTFLEAGPYCYETVIPDLPTTSIDGITGNWIPPINNTKTTVYTFTPTDTTCYNKINQIITINESPVAGMFFSPQPTDIDNPNILFEDNSNEEILTSEWYLGDGTLIYDELNFWHTYAETGTYTIKYYISNIYGCTDSIIDDLTIFPAYSIFIPDAFTPNYNGENDSFGPSLRDDGYTSYNIKIYDRWGGIIYNEDNKTWNGTINNTLLPAGVYSYSITVFDFKNKAFIYTGIVTLIR